MDFVKQCDHVVVYTEKDSAISRKHGPFRGTDYPGIITTDANSLFVNFYTDGSVQKSGFNALYRKGTEPPPPPPTPTDSQYAELEQENAQLHEKLAESTKKSALFEEHIAQLRAQNPPSAQRPKT
ncbi:hypothetical protein HPB48_004495 [Haemaphysalis longicornis]|uniref:CUB domain-containing protein n=1 Tax=Haemaphysalis longicornis TaxID=44386 RepID=A0A9J6GLJ3_HAELO|nr:hypothetical protein HPB48_004495 [Haemaphysalis longicornis]